MSKLSTAERLYNFNIQQFISQALAEDLGNGDHTSYACIPSEAIGKAQLLVKENGIVAGVELGLEIFKAVDSSLKVKVFIKDGSPIKKGDIVLTVSGKSQSILIAERLVLNCMQRMSGIATKTNSLVKLCKGTSVNLSNCRKFFKPANALASFIP